MTQVAASTTFGELTALKWRQLKIFSEMTSALTPRARALALVGMSALPSLTHLVAFSPTAPSPRKKLLSKIMAFLQSLSSLHALVKTLLDLKGRNGHAITL
jgi:hypothetical protein